MKLLTTYFILSCSLFAQEGPFKTYYPNGNVKEDVTYTNNIREGEAKLYYENGKIHEERNYVNGKIEGLVKIYSEEGTLLKTIYIEDGKRNGPTSLFTGEGVYEKDLFYADGKLVIDEPIYDEPSDIIVSDGSDNTVTEKPEPPVKRRRTTGGPLPPTLIEDEEFENDPAFFLTAEVMPEPVGGMEAINQKLVYPKAAIENKIEGTVKIAVMIDEFGEVLTAEVKEGPGFGLNEAARLAVYYSKFKPALQKGKPVKIQTTIPVEFKLPGQSGE